MWIGSGAMKAKYRGRRPAGTSYPISPQPPRTRSIGIRHGPPNDRAQGRGLRLDLVGIASEQRFRRDGIHAPTMADAVPAPDMYER